MRPQNKGCNCKRSGCLKNYCECYESKTQCNKNCKCLGCRNNTSRAALDLKALDQQLIASTLGNAAITAASQKKPILNASNKPDKVILEGKKTENEASTSKAPVEKQVPHTMLTTEVIDATIQCMISQADECEMCGLLPYQTEKMIIEELGRCLMQIIDYSTKQPDTNPSQD